MAPRTRLALAATASALLSLVVLTAPAAGAVTVQGDPSTTAGSLPSLLTVQGEDTQHDYARELFEHWIDADGDGCNTRYEVLIEESTTPVVVGEGCALSDGTWLSPYDGETWTSPSDVDVDHVVPLAEAWRSGAWSWSASQRRDFANDLDVAYSLIAVTDNVNQSKADRDPASWMPPSAAYACQYAIDWTLVKYRWRLTVDADEYAALTSVLSGSCGAQTVSLPERAAVPAPEEVVTFPDIPPGHTYYDSISWLSSTGITTGYRDGTFRPNEPVGRAAMAAFLYRFAGSPEYDAPPLSPFPDVPATYRFYTEISWLASTGITTGYSDGEFKSSEPVGRAAMAMFLYRAAGEPDFTPPARSPFPDVSTSSRYYKPITWLASVGITVGYSDGTFRPSAPVGRAAMSMFLLRFNRALGAPEFTPPANPGDVVNCGDFARWEDAQAWHDRYYPYYGDVSRLDGDGDGVACQSLPGAP